MAMKCSAFYLEHKTIILASHFCLLFCMNTQLFSTLILRSIIVYNRNQSAFIISIIESIPELCR